MWRIAAARQPFATYRLWRQWFSNPSAKRNEVADNQRYFTNSIDFPWLQTSLSQVEFGERCGFYQTYLSRVENGRANPTLIAVEVIANTLGLTVFELFDRVKELTRRGKKPGAATNPVKKAVKGRKDV